ncbi:divalent metal cation transporter [Thermobaculum terrenum]|uniref:divalent metal cation transporter n=1 Tax=Thermobaculum terrenum TaxID=166501 RepID=UPI00031AD5D3|nr:divalent metal cation transporter [Thermobaculum terrenum]
MFHGLFTALLVVGVIVALVPGLNVIGLLVFTQVLNGLLLPVVLVSLPRLVNNRHVMGGVRERHLLQPPGLGYGFLRDPPILCLPADHPPGSLRHLRISQG